MMSSILVLFLMSIHHVLAASLLTGTNDPNSLIHDRREIKEIDVLRQLINQETLIRLSVVKDVKAAVDDVNSVKLSMASTETIISSLQQTVNGLKNQVDSLAQDKRLAEKAETLQREIDTLSRQNRILTQKIENLEKQVEVNKTNFLQQEQRRENKKIAKNCENKIQETEQKFNRNITEIYELLNNRTLQTVTKDSKIITDCKDHFLQGHKQSGVYSINPFSNETQVHVYCDMETEGGGWTAIQKRVSGSVSFDRTWVEYKAGFGTPNDSYWIGNDVIHQLTKGRNASLYVSIMLQNGTILYELYQQFSVSDGTDKYKLFLGGPATGTLGDSMLDTGYPHYYDLSGMSFSTPDRDNGYNCAADSTTRGGWWFNACHQAFLNGPWSPEFWYRPWYPTVNNGALVRKTMMLIKRQ